MRFIQFRLLNDLTKVTRVGLQKTNGKIVDLSKALPSSRSLIDALTKLGSKGLVDRATQNLNGDERDYDQCEIMAPITSPSKVACVGLNYRDHCEETGKPVPAEPIFFSKFPSCIVGPFDGIPYPEVTKELDWEAELAVIIGKQGKNIDPTEAKAHIFGFTVAHDVTARDWQFNKNGGQWLLGKAMDGFCPLGPCIVTADEIPDPHKLAISCRVNGELKQNSSTSQLVHGVYDCVAWLSKFCTLLPGDIILTGTPPGVGAFAKPPLFLKKGDVVECEVEKIGIIRNQIM
ncbi:fumarylacetoacetate hydrolase domain-containing protein 2-like [Daphnia pulex]|uniref:fumarylacetoacetate hydrolase domain-containing protein 2-like n=1 Tax=Daphnia pulex TaxID=6669 RepID=UPI001EDF46AD|nr:fumarylacetoacetate hydrolase domain-containing protein 2-like [Daphnia pulex]